MVAETVKAYPLSYPPLLPLSSTVSGLNGYSCSTSSLMQASYPSSLSPPHRPDPKPAPIQRSTSQIGSQETPVGLSVAGLSITPTESSSDAQMRKKSEIFSQRKQREFIPDNKKDESYWDRRRRNNAAAKRSREKRRYNDMILEQRVLVLSRENHILKAQLNAVKEKCGIQYEDLVNIEQVLNSMPQADQILAFSKRAKFPPTLLSLANGPSVSCLLSSNSPSSSHDFGHQVPASSPPPHYGMGGSSGGRSGKSSPDYYHNDSMDMDPPRDMDSLSRQDTLPLSHMSHDYDDSPGKPLDYYEESALNLSSSRSHNEPPLSHSPHLYSPSHSSFPSPEIELLRHSPGSAEGGSSLPLKLRHKTHLGDKDAAHSLLALHGIKSEPRDHYQEIDDALGSSDERESVIGLDTSPSTYSCIRLAKSSSLSEHNGKDTNEDLEYENANLRSQVEHLMSEVANIKCMLGGRQQHHSETDSDGSR